MNEQDLDDIKELEWSRDRAAVELADAICANEYYANATEAFRNELRKQTRQKLERYKKAKRDFQDALESYEL